DLSIVVADALPAAIISGTIQAASGSLPAPLVDPGGIIFFDRYRGKGVPDGSVSVSIRLTFQAEDRTLTDAEVQQSFDTILAALGNQRLARELDTLRGRLSASDSVASELSALKGERDVIRTRVAEMLDQLEALNL